MTNRINPDTPLDPTNPNTTPVNYDNLADDMEAMTAELEGVQALDAKMSVFINAGDVTSLGFIELATESVIARAALTDTMKKNVLGLAGVGLTEEAIELAVALKEVAEAGLESAKLIEASKAKRAEMEADSDN